MQPLRTISARPHKSDATRSLGCPLVAGKENVARLAPRSIRSSSVKPPHSLMRALSDQGAFRGGIHRMKSLILSASLALGVFAFAGAAQAAEGCGPGWWRGPGGFCHPM